MQAINELVDEDTLLIVEGGHHAGAFHFHWLIQEQYYDDGQDHGKNQVARPMQQSAEDGTLGRQGRGLRDQLR